MAVYRRAGPLRGRGLRTGQKPPGPAVSGDTLEPSRLLQEFL